MTEHQDTYLPSIVLYHQLRNEYTIPYYCGPEIELLFFWLHLEPS